MAKKESNYSGYVGISSEGKVTGFSATRMDRARGAAEGFKQNYEGMKTAYETYKKKGDPSSSKLEASMRRGDEQAAATMQRTHRDADNEKIREARRGDASRPSMSRKWVE